LVNISIETLTIVTKLHVPSNDTSVDCQASKKGVQEKMERKRVQWHIEKMGKGSPIRYGGGEPLYSLNYALINGVYCVRYL